MIKLNYNDEMKVQDDLWSEEKEDVEIMGKLFKNIMDEAEIKGFKGGYVIYDGENEKIIDVHQVKGQENIGEPDGSFGHCKPLVKFLEQAIAKWNM